MQAGGQWPKYGELGYEKDRPKRQPVEEAQTGLSPSGILDHQVSRCPRFPQSVGMTGVV
jgi:hypothetical protein